MLYWSLGLVVSAGGGVALKLILAAFLSTGLNEEVISIVFLLVSCDHAVNARKDASARVNICFGLVML
jgi:hypothetical protein